MSKYQPDRLRLNLKLDFNSRLGHKTENET